MIKNGLKLCGVLLLILTSCGGTVTTYGDNVPTDLPPTILRISPSNGAVGTEVTVFGYGFSMAAPENVIAVGNAASVATTYNFNVSTTNDEMETLTFTVPGGLAAGTYPVVLVVNENASNADITFTVP